MFNILFTPQCAGFYIFVSSVKAICTSVMNLATITMLSPLPSSLFNPGLSNRPICSLIQSSAALTLQLHTRSLKYWLHCKQSNWIDLAVKDLFSFLHTIRNLHVKQTHTQTSIPYIGRGSSVHLQYSLSYRSIMQLCSQSFELGGSWPHFTCLSISVLIL